MSNRQVGKGQILKSICVIPILLIGFCGCSGVPIPDNVLYSSPPIDAEPHVVVVNANQMWQSSGIEVQKGDTLFIEAEGAWTVCNGFWMNSGPNGYQGGLEIAPNICVGHTSGLLCARLGSGQGFKVGNQFFLENASREGDLQFICNEYLNNYWDNQGQMTVSIYIKRAVEVENAKEDSFVLKKNQSNSSSVVNRWAVVVGLSEYANSGQNELSNLAYADDDAKAFANSLRNHGWSSSHIKVLTNEQATQRNIMIAMESWLTKAGPDDMIVLFWSGHGFPDPEDPEKVYFACYDTDMRIPATGYRMDKVRSAVEELGCRNVVMLADTCHAGKLITRGDEKAIGIAPYVNSLVKKNNVPKGWIFMVASDVDRKAIEDSSWSHGAFTHCLLKGLNGKADGYQSAGKQDGIVTMGELRAFMNSAMPDETQKILGVAKRPIITTSTGDPGIWDLKLNAK